MNYRKIVRLAFFISFSILTAANVSAQKQVLQPNAGEKNAPANWKTLRTGKITPINMFDAMRLAPEAVDPNSIYSNITNDTIFGLSFGSNAGPDPSDSSNTITRLIADDLQPDAPFPTTGYTIIGYRFNVVNLNSAAVSARPRIRFYLPDGADEKPGTYIGGNTLNPISFPAGGTIIYSSGTLATPIVVPAGNAFIWAGITFDNNGGTTGATANQLNSFGQSVFDPPNRGVSRDIFFSTTSPGSFAEDNPAGIIGNSLIGPPANFGWELIIAGPTAASVSISGRVSNGKRGVSRAIVHITDQNGNITTTRTNQFGYYRFTDVEVGQTLIVNVFHKRYQFDTQVVSVNEELTNLNFTGNP